MSNTTAYLIIAAFVGWVGCALLFGLWLGERRTRILMFNMQTFGTPNPGKAEVWMPGLDPSGKPRLMKDDDAESAQWSEETISKGVSELMAQYQLEEIPITQKEAREQVEQMLNSQDGTME